MVSTRANGSLQMLFLYLRGRLYKELAWESLSSRRKLHILSQFYKIKKNLAPYCLSELLPKLSSERTHYRLRSRPENLTQFSCRTSRFQKSFPGMPLNVISSLPLLQEFLVKRGHRAVMLGKLISFCSALNL